MLFRSFRVGRLFGVPTELHWSFLLVPLAILFYAYRPESGIDWPRAGWWSAVTLLLFSFVLAHELGHALAARNRGVVAERIVLFPLGGGAYIPREPGRVRDEVLIYAAGPLANVLLALIALPLLLGQPNGEYLLRYYLNPFGNILVLPSLAERVLGMTIAVNLVLAAGNLLPAYPLDGGRILRALLRRPLGDRRATVVTTLLGLVVGGGLVVVALRIGDPLLGLSALFIVAFSAFELNRGWQRRSLQRTALTQVLRPVPEQRLYASDSASRGRELFAATDAAVLPVYTNWNELSGFVERELLQREATAGDRVAPHHEAEYITARATDDLLPVIERIVAADVYGAAVYAGTGRMIGFVYTEDVIRLLNRSPRRFYRRFTNRV